MKRSVNKIAIIIIATIFSLVIVYIHNIFLSIVEESAPAIDMSSQVVEIE